MSSQVSSETMERVQVQSDTGPSKEEGKTNHRRETREGNGEKSGS